MLRKRTWILLTIALGLRLLLLGWDSGFTSSSLHPDERQVSFVSERLDGWFADPDFFAYGSLHFQATRIAAGVTGMGQSLRDLTLSGRMVSLAASMLALILGWVLARRAWGVRTADLFLLLIAWVPLDLQQSHFSTVEAHHTLWVVAALAACFWLATGGKATAAVSAGAAVGASLAVKVASLPLGLPLALAVMLASRARWVDMVRLASLAATSMVVTFWLCQPWSTTHARPPWLLFGLLAAAVLCSRIAAHRAGRGRLALVLVATMLVAVAALQVIGALGYLGDGRTAELVSGPELNTSYVRGVGEQVRMVLGDADLPYVRVYAHTVPVLYPLRELGLWGWGPMLLLAAIWAAASGCRRLATRWRRWIRGRWNDGTVLLLLLLSWLVPMSVRLSTLQVKYLRYWEPLVVPAVLVTAWWLCRLHTRRRRAAAAAVVAGTTLWGVAYLWAFIDPHPHRVATDWLRPMLGDGQVVAFESWDEALPVEGAGGAVDRINLPSYDLPDDDAKARRWAAELTRADWVVLTSNRVMRTVLANPQRFERTSRLYALLLSGETGFEPVTRVNRGPRLFGLRSPVQKADESFVNYEFPQVLIFRRVADVSADEIVERTQRPLPFLEGLGFADLERRFITPVPTLPSVPSGLRQVLDTSLWLALFAALGAAAWLLLLPLLRGLPDAGAGLALATGWLLPPWLLWLGSELGIVAVGEATATWIFLAIAGAAGFCGYRRRNEIVEISRTRRGAILRVLAVTLAVGLFFLLVRASNPAIHWGEKPMDFAFLNAFVQSPAWPPGEPWMAGMPLHYYYFGEVLAAFPILVTGCSPGVGYNLVAASIPAFGAAVLASFGLVLARRRRWFAAGVLPLLVLLTGNLAWPWLLHLASQGKWFDLWWATSRVVPGFAIDEYPLWTALFADVHGHFIALPVLLTTLYWGWITVRAPERRWLVPAGLCAVSAAVLVATNPWDLFILTATLGASVLASARKPLAGLGRLAAAGGLSLLAAAPFISELVAGINAGAGGRGLFLTDADFAPAWAVLRHFGLFLVPLAAVGLTVLGRRWWWAAPAAGLGVAGGLAFGSSAAALALGATAVFGMVAIVSRTRMDRFAWSMATLGVLAIAACERFTLIDRMNTLFKVYNGVWVVLAVALATMLLRSRGLRRRVLIATWLPLQLAAAVNLPLGVVQGWLQPRISSPRPSIDGQAFLATGDPQTWFLTRALHGMAGPGDVVAESAGPYYSQHTRIVMHTGQPTVVGWDWHLKQRGQPVAEINARFEDLESLYSGGSPVERRAILDRYRVRWVVLADLERQRYGLTGRDVLSGIPGLIKIAEHEGAALFMVRDLRSASEPIAPVLELPRGVSVIAEIPETSHEIVRSMELDAAGAVVALRDGQINEFDLGGRLGGTVPPPPCELSAVTRWREVHWSICSDGRLFRRGGGGWQLAGRLEGADRISSGTTLWAWGDGGLWQFGDRAWRPFYSGRVTAAAVNAEWIAFSDGTTVLLGREGVPTTVAGALDGVRSLAWQGTSLVAADSAGLHRSGGALLPWRRVLPEVGTIVALAGQDRSLWMVRSDGLVIQSTDSRCPPAWEVETAPTGRALREPRDLAVSPEGWFVVADTQNHRVRWYSNMGACLDEFGIEGTGIGEFREPSGLALAPDGSLAVTDTWNGRVQLIRSTGEVITVGSSLFGPRDALWTSDGSLLVADTGNSRLLRYDPPDWREEEVTTFPGPVVGLASVLGAIAAAVPADGAVFVVDPSNGETVRRLEVPGWSSREQQESYLAVLPSGYLAATAPRTGEVWAVDPSGQEPAHKLRGGLPGVTGIALHPDGHLAAALTWEHRLERLPLEE